MEKEIDEEKIKKMAQSSLEVLKEKFPDESKYITEEMLEEVLRKNLQEK